MNYQNSIVNSIPILYQDKDIIVINKPAQLLSVPGRGPDKQDSVQIRLQQYFANIHVVHRLDQATCGVMVFARHKPALRALHQQFVRREVHKCYAAIVWGVLQGSGKIDLPLGPDWPNRPRQKVDYTHGKACLTHWQSCCVIHTPNALLTRLRLYPKTGRSHQLRLHLAAISHPIAGDRLYGQPWAVELASNLQLQAVSLSFSHPQNHQPMFFRCSDMLEFAC